MERAVVSPGPDALIPIPALRGNGLPSAGTPERPFVDGLLQQGREQGEEKGAVKSKIEDLIKVIRARGLELTQAQVELVTSCADLSRLAAWFDQALDAKTTDEIFGAP
jgi:hypothetical protein